MARATADGVSIRGREGGGALESVTKRIQRDCRNFTKWRVGKGRGKRGGLVGCGVERLQWGAAVIREKRVGVGVGVVMVVVVNGIGRW